MTISAEEFDSFVEGDIFYYHTGRTHSGSYVWQLQARGWMEFPTGRLEADGGNVADIIESRFNIGQSPAWVRALALGQTSFSGEHMHIFGRADTVSSVLRRHTGG